MLSVLRYFQIKDDVNRFSYFVDDLHLGPPFLHHLSKYGGIAAGVVSFIVCDR